MKQQHTNNKAILSAMSADWSFNMIKPIRFLKPYRFAFFIIAIIATSFTTQLANAQNPTLEWAKSMGGVSYAQGWDIAVDAAGNVYTTGEFADTVDFDPGVGVSNLISNGERDIFISKLDAVGNFVWAKSMGGVSPDVAHSIALDALGNVYTTGYFSFTVDFDPNGGVANITSNGGNRDIFISKLDAAGNFVWAKSMGYLGQDWALSISLDAANNVYTTGFFHGTVDFDPNAGVANLTSNGNDDIFISKLDAAGNFVWAKNMGGTSSDVALSISLDAVGNIYTTGYFIGTADFDPNGGIFNLTSSGSYDIFISKLDAAGNFIWAKSMGGSQQDFGNSIALDALGNVYMGGTFQDIVDFDPGVGVFNLTSVGQQDIFISKLDAAGNFLWAKSMGSINYTFGNSIALDALGNVYTTGYFGNTIDFDPGAGVFNLTSNGNGDIFISKLDVAGNFVWAKSMGSTSGDGGNSIALDAANNVYTTGLFNGTVDFDPNAGVTNLTAIGSSDIFVHKMSQSCIEPQPPTNTSTAANMNICVGFSTNLSASGVGILGWYDAAVGGNYLGSGTSFTTPVYTVAGNTIVYVQDSTCMASTTRTPVIIIVNTSPTLGTAIVSTANVCPDESYTITYTPPSCDTNVGFQDSYQIGNWALSQTPAASNGAVNTSLAPAVINMQSSNGASGGGAGTTSYSIIIPCNGIVSFNWNYSTVDGATWDYPRYSINGSVPILFTGFDLGGSNTQNGTESIVVTAGQTLSLESFSVDNTNGSCYTIISNFFAPIIANQHADFFDAPTGGSVINHFFPYSNSMSFVTTQSSDVSGYYSYFTAAHSNSSYGCHSVDRIPLYIIVNAPFMGSLNAIATPPCLGSDVTMSYTAPTCTPSAGFQFTYDPSNWITTQAPATTNGTINTTLAPQTITMVSSDNQSGIAGITSYKITVPCTGTLSFDWNYSTFDGAGAYADYPQYSIDGGAPILFTGFDINGGDTQSGTVSIAISAGQNISLQSYTYDNLFSSCVTVISHFVAPTIPNQSVKWYDSFVGGNYLGSGNSLVQMPLTTGSYTYYAAIHDNVTGCDAYNRIATNAVIINALPIVNVTSSANPICEGGLTTLTATGADSYLWNPGGLGGASVVVAPTATTTYTVTGLDINGCENSTTITINVNPSPIVSVAASANPICTGSSTTLTVTGADSYIWYPGSLGGTSVVVAPTATTTFTVTGFDANNCENSTTITVTVNPLPSVIVSASANSICEGSSTTLTVTGADSYIWYPGSLGGTSVVVAPTATTTYTVTGLDVNGCENTGTKTIIVNPLPNVVASASSSNLCVGGSTTLTVTGANTYTWNPGSLSGTTITVAPTATTTYTVAGVNINGCVNTGTKTIIVNPLPTANAGIDKNLNCTTTSTTIGTAAIAGNNYSWSPATALSSTTSAVPTANPVVTTTYTLTVTSSNGCISTDVVVVNVNTTVPTANAGIDKNLNCNTTSTTIGTAAIAGNTYSWSPATALSSTTSAVPTANPVVTTTYTVTVTSSNGCMATDIVVVNVNTTLPTANAGIDKNLNCTTTSTTIGTAAIAGNTYSWSPATALSSATSAIPTANPIATTTYTLTVTSSNGCMATDVVVVNVNTMLPTANGGIDKNLNCTTTSTTIGTAAIAGNTYSWSPATALSSTTSAVPTANPIAATTYTLTVTSSNGCMATDVVVVNVNTTVPTANAGIDKNLNCTTTSTTIGTAAQAGNTYSWSPATALSSATSAVPTANPVVTTTYTLTVTSSNGCIATDVVVVNVNTTVPTANAGIDKNLNCTTTSTTIGTAAQAGNTYSWSPATALSSTTSAVPTANPIATTTYTLTVTSSNGCMATDVVVVNVNTTAPTVGTTATSTSIACGASTSITGIGAITYSWQPGLLSGSTITVNPITTTTYTVVGTDVNGCTNSSTRMITVAPCGSTVNLTFFIEGYYLGAGLMDNVLQNQTVVGATATQTDTITVELRNTVFPFGIAATLNTILNTNGTAICNFPTAGTFYLAVKHRNGLQTWSANPITISAIPISYNFSDAANNAYGSNQVSLGAGVFGIYSGDFNDDENIDLLDIGILEDDINLFSFGYFATDINGDGNVDLLDSPILEANINGFVFSSHP